MDQLDGVSGSAQSSKMGFAEQKEYPKPYGPVSYSLSTTGKCHHLTFPWFDFHLRS